MFILSFAYAFRRCIAASLLRAQEEGYFNAFIVCPSIVHGIGGGPLKRPSLAFKYFAADALERKQVAYIGEGSNRGDFVGSNVPHSWCLYQHVHRFTSKIWQKYIWRHSNSFWRPMARNFNPVHMNVSLLLKERALITRRYLLGWPRKCISLESSIAQIR